MMKMTRRMLMAAVATVPSPPPTTTTSASDAAAWSIAATISGPDAAVTVAMCPASSNKRFTSLTDSSIGWPTSDPAAPLRTTEIFM